MLNQELVNKLNDLSSPENLSAVIGITRGIERETLRVKADGSLSQKPHPDAFGSALTHPYITTDYSEALLEFITPASTDANKTMAQLTDIHAFVVKNLGDEYLWPISMPCYVRDEDDIQLANYGTSNSGQMKHLYRQGLKFRYGSFMQVISGIHFNLSFSESLWETLAKREGLDGSSQDFKSEQYLNLIRNFKRNVWLLTYLYGASPALCGSFIGERASKYPFEKIGNGGLYLPYATSLRLSDLGYTSNAQSELNISYSSLKEYVAGLREAIKTPVDAYKIPAQNPNGHAQLNNNLLQIENEFYSPVRPKRTAASNEKPTDALAERGIEYVEIRSMDVNPYSPVGIDLSQIHFLDVFLSYCLLKESPVLCDAENNRVEENHTQVILRGRDPELKLKHHDNHQDRERTIADWGSEVFDELDLVAAWLDKASDSDVYRNVVGEQRKAVIDPDLTLSAKFLNELKAAGVGSGLWSLNQAKINKELLANTQSRLFDDELMKNHAVESIAKQKVVEDSDKEDFETFLEGYFAG
ncbi:MAG: glutamate--cysteine ligase [Algicola sp.]|nr:glutamate--cysteine ligase [Algicola sp.]